jgi:hypothetical protein
MEENEIDSLDVKVYDKILNLAIAIPITHHELILKSI